MPPRSENRFVVGAVAASKKNQSRGLDDGLVRAAIARAVAAGTAAAPAPAPAPASAPATEAEADLISVTFAEPGALGLKFQSNEQTGHAEVAIVPASHKSLVPPPPSVLSGADPEQSAVRQALAPGDLLLLCSTTLFGAVAGAADDHGLLSAEYIDATAAATGLGAFQPTPSPEWVASLSPEQRAVLAPRTTGTRAAVHSDGEHARAVPADEVAMGVPPPPEEPSPRPAPSNGAVWPVSDGLDLGLTSRYNVVHRVHASVHASRTRTSRTRVPYAYTRPVRVHASVRGRRAAGWTAVGS